MPAWNPRANEIFLAALDIEDVSERRSHLDAACGDDAELRRQVDALLAAHQEAGSYLEQPAGADVTGAYVPSPQSAIPNPQSAIGSRIGPYKLLQQIGEGGMGVVYMAEQEQPVRRRVAVKIIKPGMNTSQVIARFEAERQALALMDHQNIAKVLDAGATDAGHPFFVMELVHGIPITQYCDREHLSPRERLDLFICVCQAVQHAHQKGIIHRDLKPSNVLIALYDGKPVPKVIDFGVAKATSQRLTERTMFTEFGQVIGTLEYMSPEQAELNALDIDTRSDIYSLGVLLYELLTGSTPLDRKNLQSAAYDEMLRIIREVEPPKPSTRLSSSEQLPSIAANRKLEPKRLTNMMHGDLDWIAMKCLEKDRARRYETANQLALEVRRFLADEPVLAGPPSAGYRIRKFVRRNKGGVTAIAAVAAALLIGIVGFAWQARIAQNERDTAQTERDTAQTERNTAQTERKRAVIAEDETKKRADELQKVSDFQGQMLGQVDPNQAGKLLSEDVQAKFEAALVKAGVPESERRGQVAAFSEQWKRINATDAARELIDRTILKPAIGAIEKQFADQPMVDARLRQVLANRYRDMGLYDAALPLQKRALETGRRVLGEEHPYTLTSINNMGSLLQAQGKLSEAEPYYRESLEKKRRVMGEEHPDTLIAINNLGNFLRAQGKLSEAEPFLREALEKFRRLRGDEHPATLASIGNLGTLLLTQGKLSEAEPYLSEELEKKRRVLGEEHPSTLNSINKMGFLLRAQGKLSEAEPYFREALEKYRRVRGEEHPETLTSINNMAALLKDQGKLSEADTYLREALEKKRRVLGEEHPETLQLITNMGILLQAQGRHAEAAGLLSPAESAARKAFTGGNAWRLASLLMNLGKARAGLREFAAAETNLLEAQPIFIRARGPTHQDTRDCTQLIVDLYAAWHAAEPGKGYDGKMAEWKAKLAALPAKP